MKAENKDDEIDAVTIWVITIIYLIIMGILRA